MYILLLIILLLIIYDILITKKEDKLKKNKVKKEIKNKEIKQEETGFLVKKKDINEDCLYKINENNDNCTLKNGCFKNNECKINISSIENLHPSSFDWSSLNIKY